jgi:hypothetical protein
MGCCGESASTPDIQYANRPQPVNPGLINHQPGPHPGAQHQPQSPGEKPHFLIPQGPSPPPPSLQQNNQPLNGSSWIHTPSPPPRASVYSGPLSPSLNHLGVGALTPPPATYVPSGPSNSAVFFPPLLHPDPIHVPRNGTVSPSVSTAVVHTSPAGNDPVPSNEGKMSISIDFGEYSHRCVCSRPELIFA